MVPIPYLEAAYTVRQTCECDEKSSVHEAGTPASLASFYGCDGDIYMGGNANVLSVWGKICGHTMLCSVWDGFLLPCNRAKLKRW